MVVFEYDVDKVNNCHFILKNMDLPGNPVNKQWLGEDSLLVWEGTHFIGVLNTESKKMELYGTHTTNSVKYFKKRYPLLEWDKVSVIKTKRWNQ